MSGSFTYTSEPHSAPRLYSQTMPVRGVPLTIMSDPRVVRGNTHSLARKISKARSDEIKEKKTVKILEKRAAEEEESYNMPFYSFVTKPFAEEDVDIMKYLVEPEDAIVLTKECTTQVDEFKPLPAPLSYIPRKTGVDKHTQVEDERELFVFDLEVAPMLEVIVRKTLEQAVVEVEQEYELHLLHNEVARYEEIMHNESNWMQEQESNIKKKQEDIRQQLHDILATKAAERQIKLGVAGIQMINQLVPAMLDSIHSESVENGTWYLPDNENVQKNILPNIILDTSRQVQSLMNAENVVDDLLQEAVTKFDGIEKTVEQRPLFKLVVHIVKALEPSDNADEGDANAKKETIKEVELEIPIKLEDTTSSLQKKLKNNLQQLNSTQGNEGEEVVKDSAFSGDFKLLPKINSHVGTLYQSHGLPPIDVPEDAILMNYPLSSDIIVYFHV